MLSFVKQAVKDFKNTGSVWPSSPQLGKAMTRSLRKTADAANGVNGSSNGSSHHRVLEVGPGTGPFTKMVLEILGPGDEFDIVELNEAFCRDLEKGILAPIGRNERKPKSASTVHQLKRRPSKAPTTSSSAASPSTTSHPNSFALSSAN